MRCDVQHARDVTKSTGMAEIHRFLNRLREVMEMILSSNDTDNGVISMLDGDKLYGNIEILFVERQAQLISFQNSAHRSHRRT